MSLIKGLAKFLIPLIIAFVTLEIGVRVIQRSILGVNQTQYEQYKKIYSDERDKPYLFWHKPDIQTTLEDNGKSFRFSTNKFGHRSLTDRTSFENSIVFLGDSIIEGSSVHDEQTLPFLIQKRLSVPTVNLGVGASNTVQEYYALKEKLLPDFNAELLVLGFCLNDIEQNLYRRAFNESEGNWEYFDDVVIDNLEGKHYFTEPREKKVSSLAEALRGLMRQSEAFLLMHRIYRTLGGPRLTELISYESEKVRAESWLNTEYFLNQISLYANKKNMELLVVIFPTANQINGKESFQDQANLKQILERNRIEYLDAADSLLAYRKHVDDDARLFHDNMHPNSLGTAVIADGLSEYLTGSRPKFAVTRSSKYSD